MRFPGGIEPDPSRTHSGSGRMPKISLTPKGGQLLERPGLRTATWIYEVSYRQKRRLQAIKIVLQFRAEVHKRREERTASIMNRVASLPSELLLEVVEACVESQVGCWNVQDSPVQPALAYLADKCFFAWPRGITDDTRNTLRLESANALIKASIVQIPMAFAPHNRLVVPPLLVERQHDLRRLALDLHTTPMNGSYNRELNKTIKAMPSLGKDFPNMKVFVLSLYFHSRTEKNSRPFKSEVLKMRNIKRIDAESGWQHSTIQDTTVDLVQAFAESAPGPRKLIRFGDVSDTDGYGYPWVGPLVEVSSSATQTFEQAHASEINNTTTRGDDLPRTNAERIFKQSYHAARAVRDRQARASLLYREQVDTRSITIGR